MTQDQRLSRHPVFGMMEPFIEQKAIDLTAFLGQWPTRLQISASASDLSNLANQYNLEGICVSHFASIFGFDTRSGNEALFAEVSGDRRLWPYAILNPTEPAWEHELDWAIQMGTQGIRIVPGYHRYSLLDPQVAKLIQRLTELNIPLHVCARLEDERLQHPRMPAKTPPFYELAELLRLAEHLPVVISGLRAREWKNVKELLNEGHRLDHVLLDLWFTNGPLGIIAALCREGATAQFAYGSCAPLHMMEATVFQLATADIRDDERHALCRDNALKLLRPAAD